MLCVLLCWMIFAALLLHFVVFNPFFCGFHRYLISSQRSGKSWPFSGVALENFKQTLVCKVRVYVTKQKRPAKQFNTRTYPRLACIYYKEQEKQTHVQQWPQEQFIISWRKKPILTRGSCVGQLLLCLQQSAAASVNSGRPSGSKG